MIRAFTQVILICACLTGLAITSTAQFQYSSPIHGSKYHNPTTSIILRNGENIELKSLATKNLFRVEGSVSGNHDVQVSLREKGKTIVLKTEAAFAFGETVTVNIGAGVRTSSGRILEGKSFSFEIMQERTQEQNLRIAQQMKQLRDEEFHNPEASLRGGLPEIDILTNTTPAPGQVFFSHFNYFDNIESHYCIIESNGDSVYGKFDTVTYNNFELNKNGNLTVYNESDSSFVMLDSNYKKIGKFQMEGYIADVHEFVIFPEGDYYMLSYDPQIVDMTVYDQSYMPDATVVGCIIQHFDENKDLIFEWRSWDHYSILDGDHVVFSNSMIDYCHANTITVDTDGNLLFCCRNMSEVTKINRATGDMMWRWGGKNNQFTFINDPDKFSYQHDVIRIANGNITMFDNGNYHAPQKSYAKEYTLNEVNKTATLVWSYKRSIGAGDVFSKAMGSVQRLPNGNSLINWGLVLAQPAAPNVTEVTPSGTIVWEMELDDDDAIYRARRYVWKPCARPSPANIYVDNITAQSAKVHWKAATNATSYDVYYKRVGNYPLHFKNTTKTNRKLKGLQSDETYEYWIVSHCDNNPTTLSNATKTKTFTTLPLKIQLTQEIEKISAFEIYPNPASDALQLNLNLSGEEDVIVSFFDFSGKMVSQTVYHLNAGSQSLNFDLTNFNPGIYIAKVHTTSGNMIEKFVKQ